MPDIKTAMANILNEWAADDTPFVPKVIPPTQPEPATMNNQTTSASDTSVSEQTFNYILNNPYVTIQKAVEALTARGCNPNSTGSLIYQMIRCGMVSRDKDDKLTALHKRYSPVQTRVNALRHARKVKKVRQPSGPRRRELGKATESAPVVLDLRQDKAEGIAALNAPVAQPTPAAVTATPLMTAEQVLKTLSVKEAHALYRELQTMFG
jgi:hypothetical protein